MRFKTLFYNKYTLLNLCYASLILNSIFLIRKIGFNNIIKGYLYTNMFVFCFLRIIDPWNSKSLTKCWRWNMLHIITFLTIYQSFGSVTFHPLDMESFNTDPPVNVIKFRMRSSKFINNASDDKIVHFS